MSHRYYKWNMKRLPKFQLTLHTYWLYIECQGVCQVLRTIELSKAWSLLSCLVVKAGTHTRNLTPRQTVISVILDGEGDRSHDWNSMKSGPLLRPCCYLGTLSSSSSSWQWSKPPAATCPGLLGHKMLPFTLSWVYVQGPWILKNKCRQVAGSLLCFWK